MPTTEPLPARVPITLYRGDTRVWDDTFSLDGEPMPLDGYTFSCQVRDQPERSDRAYDPGAQPMAVIEVDVLDAAAGRIRRTLTHDESAKLVPGRAYWDLQLIRAADGYVRTYLAGPVTIVGDVSRA